MDWMYKGLAGNVDREEYLIGRKIDKTFEIMQKEENPNKYQDEEESALINQLATAKYLNTNKNDEVTKLKEDPLFDIKSKQQEKLKELLHNPLKLKQLQQKLELSLQTDKAAKKKKKQKKKYKDKKSKHREHKKKHRSKRKHHSSGNSTEESSANSSESESEKEERRYRNRHSRDKDQHQHTRDSDHQRRNHSRDDERRTIKEHCIKKYSSSSSSSSLSKASKSREERKPAAPEAVAPKRPKLTEEELQRRREEMINNAVQRDEDRAHQVQRLNERERLMDERDEQSKSGGGHFIKPILNNIASSASIEDSIRKKRFTSQRPGPSMEENNFARRK